MPPASSATTNRTRRYLAVALIVAAPITAAAARSVTLDTGLISSVTANGLDIFKGIPFAAPPVGPLRWRPPQPALPWPGVRTSDRFSPICMQSGSYPEDAPPEPMSEDCLYLNLWVPPGAAGQKLPVMVWIYGGGLINGSASTPLYAGDQLARQGVIVVTANYRLGVLGFLAHAGLTQESPDHVSGNYGLLDQIAALRWVHRNIAAFGGDPDQVTVFGQSSGSISISELAVSPLAAGLFRRAIGQSGGLFEPLELADDYKLPAAEQEGAEFAAAASSASISALRAKPAADLIKLNFMPHTVIDGVVLKASPFQAYQHGQQNPLDLLVGYNADEGSLFIANRTVAKASMQHVLKQDFPAAVVALAGPATPGNDQAARAAAIRFEGDMRFGWDMWSWAQLAAAHGKGHVYFYNFSRVPPYRAGDRYAGWGASHGMEMPYVFDHLDQQPLGWTQQDRTLATTMSTYWVNFAKSGDPNGPGLPVWPAFGTDAPQVMTFGDTIVAGPVAQTPGLRRIDRLYWWARTLVFWK